MTTSPPTASPRRSACRSTSTRACVAHLASALRRRRASSTRRACAWRASRTAPILVDNKISKAPGFWIGNVIVMAGVPSIMQAMLDAVGAEAQDRRQDALGVDARGRARGRYRHARSARSPRRNPDVIIGSYPFFDGPGPTPISSCARATRRNWPPRRRRSRQMLAQVHAKRDSHDVHAEQRRPAHAASRRAAKAFPGLLGPVPSRRPRAGLAARRRRAVRGDRLRSRAAALCRRRSSRASSASA